MATDRTPEELMNDVVNAYEESTGNVPDVPQYVVIEDLVANYLKDDK